MHSQNTSAHQPDTAHIDALIAARASVPHGWIRQANPHRLAPAFKAAGDAAREAITNRGASVAADPEVETILTRIDNFAADPGSILDRRKTALSLSSTLTNAIARRDAAQ